MSLAKIVCEIVIMLSQILKPAGELVSGPGAQTGFWEDCCIMPRNPLVWVQVRPVLEQVKQG